MQRILRMVAYGASLCALSRPALADGVICFDRKNTVLAEAPRGWIADYESGKKIGLCVVFYPRGTTFHTTPALIYPNLVTTDEALQPFIEGDLERFSRTTGSKVETLPAIRADDQMSFELRRLVNGPPPNEHEIIAYHAADGAILLAVLSARTAANIDAYRGSFQTFLEQMRVIPQGGLYPALARIADDDSKKPGGAEYQRRLMSSIGKYLADAMRACAKPTSEGFSAVIQVNDRGAIAEWINDSNGPLGACVRGQMKSVQGPPPPFAPFHAKLRMALKK